MAVQIQNWPTSTESLIVGTTADKGLSRGQVFTTSDAFSCTGISFLAFRTGLPGILTANIYAVDGSNLPILDTSLAVGTIDSDTFGTTSPGTEQTITFNTPVSLSASTKYCYVLSSEHYTFGLIYVTVRSRGDNPYSYGGGIVDGAVGWTYSASVDHNFRIYGDSGAEKPTTPNPANGSGPGIDFSDWTFGWVDGGSADSFNVYAGVSSGSLNFVANTASTSYQIPEGNAFRTTLLDSVIYWRVDAVAGEDVVTGDEWNFDPRPGKASNPSPADTATNQRLNTTPVSWDAGDYADTYTVYLSGSLAPISIEQAGLTCALPVPLDYSEIYTWRVDSINEFGTTTGDEWTFSTIASERVWTTARYRADRTLVPDGTTFDPNTMYYTGDNFTVGGIGRLLSVSETGLWYEEI